MMMKRWSIVGLLLLVVFANAQSTTNVPPQPEWWTGHNQVLDQYYVQPGYPDYPEHARYIGDLQGTWMEMGEQYGERAGDYVRLVFEGYYDQIFARIGDADKMLADGRLLVEYLSKLVPEAVEFMRGIAAGSEAELAKSVRADYGDAFDKVVLINHYFALRRVLGTQYLGGGQTASSASPEIAALSSEDLPACTGVVLIGGVGGATTDRRTYHGGTKDQVFFPQLYQVTYTTTPSDPNAHRIWTVSSAGEIGGQMAGNDQGVIVTGYAGGNAMNLWAYGLEWNIGVWYGATFAGSTDEAASILTVGRPGFIEATGEKIVTPAWGINWLISDATSAAYVEIVPGRYAVRRPGDFGEGYFLVGTNHNLSTWSYDHNNERTDVPMTDYGNESGDYTGLSASGTRYWTMFWNAKYNEGNIDRNMVMSWYQTSYYINKDGVRVDFVWAPDHGWVSSHLLRLTPFRHSGLASPWTGTTTDAKVGVSQDLAFYFTQGRGGDWVGPWDVLTLKYRQ